MRGQRLRIYGSCGMLCGLIKVASSCGMLCESSLPFYCSTGEATCVHYTRINKTQSSVTILLSLKGLKAMTANTINQASPFKMKV